MKSSAIYTIALILFIVVAIGYSVIKESKAKGVGEKTSSGNEVATSVPSPPNENLGKQEESPDKSSDKVIVYYFHGNKRCTSCIKIENYTKEAIEKKYADEIQNGRIIWKVVNVDKPENEHFISDYQLTTKSVVLVKTHNGKQVKWKNLSAVWNYLNDKNAFLNYVQNEVYIFMEEQ